MLAQCRVLQSPDDFVVTIRQSLKPIRGRPVFADILPGTWDWVRFFEDLRLNVTGIAASHAHPRVCFSKRFLQLRDLPKLNLPGWELEVPALFKDTDRHPRDVVMVCKQFWASDQLAQPPQLWCPHSWYAQLRQVPWARKDRNVISERQKKEYRKTAEAAVQKPWCLLRAGAYLEKWVADNEAGTYGAPPTIPLLTSMVSSEPVWAEDMAVEWQEYAPAPPVRIEVGPPKKRHRVEPQAVCGDRPRDVIPWLFGVRPEVSESTWPAGSKWRTIRRDRARPMQSDDIRHLCVPGASDCL